MIPPPPRSTLFPYTTLFRSCLGCRRMTRWSCITAPTPERISLAARAKLIWTCNGQERWPQARPFTISRSEEHTSELQSHSDLVCRLLLEKKKSSTANLASQE